MMQKLSSKNLNHYYNFSFVNSLGEKIDIVIAPLFLRIIAFILDIFFLIILQFILFFTLLPFFQYFASFSSSFISISLLMLSFITYFFYFFIQEAFYKGQTIGKYIMKLRVISAAGGQISIKESFIRNSIKYVEVGYFSIIGVIIILLNSHNKRLGDILADTFVIFEEPK